MFGLDQSERAFASQIAHSSLVKMNKSFFAEKFLIIRTILKNLAKDSLQKMLTTSHLLLELLETTILQQLQGSCTIGMSMHLLSLKFKNKIKKFNKELFSTQGEVFSKSEILMSRS